MPQPKMHGLVRWCLLRDPAQRTRLFVRKDRMDRMRLTFTELQAEETRLLSVRQQRARQANRILLWFGAALVLGCAALLLSEYCAREATFVGVRHDLPTYTNMGVANMHPTETETFYVQFQYSTRSGGRLHAAAVTSPIAFRRAPIS